MEEIYAKQNEALSVLIDAVKFAQLKGTYSLEQAELIIRAIKVFQNQEQITEQVKNESGNS